MSLTLRGFRVLMGFSFQASRWRATFFLLSGVVMSATYPIMAYGSELLVDAAVSRDLAGALAAVLLAFTVGLGVINALHVAPPRRARLPC